MGLFRKKNKNKTKSGFHGFVDTVDSYDDPDNYDSRKVGDPNVMHKLELEEESTASVSDTSSNRVKETAINSSSNNNSNKAGEDGGSLEFLATYISELQNCEETFAERPSRALRSLFSLSEHHSLHEINRIRMVREDNGRLIPTLLNFLQQCTPNSSEQYLALLVLNNLSIPSENKRIIAIENKAARILSKLLCWHPETSLIAIILVNLCFCDAALRSELVRKSSSDDSSAIYLVEAFMYSLKMSILPEGEDSNMQKYLDETRGWTPKTLLKHYNELNQERDDEFQHDNLPFSNNIAHPDTAKWCLCGIKNLTRPAKDPTAAQVLFQSGITNVVLRVLTIHSGATRQASNEFNTFSSSNYRGINIDDEVACNDPYTWGNNSMQDAALYILMNLAITPSTRPFLRNPIVAKKVGTIAKFSTSPQDSSSKSVSKAEESQKDLQCVKARMILAYLFGSENPFGLKSPSDNENQPSKMSIEQRRDILLIKGSEAPLLVELLANTLHSRGKRGPGGYNGSTFNAKKALYALRCLLTVPLNVKTFFVTCGVKLNALLLKTLALHSIEHDPNIDLEAAEDACFSLYLLSDHGFMASFLPSVQEGYPFENIVHCYFKQRTCTSAGKHAAMQLLMRRPYLQMDGSVDDSSDEPKNVEESDLSLGDTLYHAALEIPVTESTIGVKPLDDIFGRPLLRRRPAANNNPSDETEFNSALDAVKDLSFGSGRNHESSIAGVIDDIEIANNVALCANGQSEEIYGFQWTWQDTIALRDNERDVRKKLNEFRNGKMDAFKGLLKNVGNRERTLEPITIFGINCGCNSVVVD